MIGAPIQAIGEPEFSPTKRFCIFRMPWGADVYEVLKGDDGEPVAVRRAPFSLEFAREHMARLEG